MLYAVFNIESWDVLHITHDIHVHTYTCRWYTINTGGWGPVLMYADNHCY